MENLFEPVGTPAEKFLLMLHERIVALEGSNDAIKAQVEQHGETISRLIELTKADSDADECPDCTKSYDAAADKFSDCLESIIDWFIWEPVNSIHIMNQHGPPCLVPANYWSIPVILPRSQGKTHVDLEMPVERWGSRGQHRTLSLPAQLDVLAFFTALHAFYDTPITSADLADHDPRSDESGVPYVSSALSRIAAGERVTWSDMLGVRNLYTAGSGPDTANRRQPLSCSGSVRFEGIEVDGSVLCLRLGS